VWFF